MYNYNNLSYRTLRDIMSDLKAPIPTPKREFRIHTGFLGMIAFDLAMLGLSMPTGKTSIYQPKRGRTRIVFSLFKKHGPLKVQVIAEDELKLHLYSGTNLIARFKHWESVYKYIKNNKLKEDF